MESLLGYVQWHVHPEIFRIGPFAVRWYGLLFVSSFIFGFFLLKRVWNREGYPIDSLDKLTMYMMVATIIGARLGHCLFYDPGYYLSHPFEIIKIWEGGLASHGAALGIIAGIYIFVRKYKEFRFLWVIDRVVLVVALSGFFIRTGNLMNSEIYGHISYLPWAFIFPDEIVPRHPTQIYEALCYLLLFLFLVRFYYKNFPNFKEGTIFSIFLIVLFTIRFFIEFLKEPQVAFESNLPLNLGQLLSLPFIALGIILLVYLKSKPVKDNEISEESKTQL
jgi:phosphatidylglycerol---prolipoprotein diacylglyceryl transferase